MCLNARVVWRRNGRGSRLGPASREPLLPKPLAPLERDWSHSGVVNPLVQVHPFLYTLPPMRFHYIHLLSYLLFKSICRVGRIYLLGLLVSLLNSYFYPYIDRTLVWSPCSTANPGHSVQSAMFIHLKFTSSTWVYRANLEVMGLHCPHGCGWPLYTIIPFSLRCFSSREGRNNSCVNGDQVAQRIA